LPVGTRTSATSDFTANDAEYTDFSFHVDWTMGCGGRPGKCKGEIDVVPPGGTDIKIPQKLQLISCDGSCSGEGVDVWKGSFRVRGSSALSLDKDRRANKSFTFRLERYCLQDGTRVAAGDGSITIAYGATGLFDRRRSDLNGDGQPDGLKSK